MCDGGVVMRAVVRSTLWMVDTLASCTLKRESITLQRNEPTHNTPVTFADRLGVHAILAFMMVSSIYRSTSVVMTNITMYNSSSSCCQAF